jgi:chaperonin GroEL
MQGVDAKAVFDVRQGQALPAEQAGIWDATEVLKTAVSTAIAGAALALTTDVIIHHKRPKTVLEP